jgi:N-acyl-L-homoserine lactone synthetase
MNAISRIIRDIEDEFCVETVIDPSLLERIYELRYQVYCTERGFLPGFGGQEFDEFDSRSRHVALLVRRTGELVGTARMVLSSPLRPHESFPLQKLCCSSLMTRFPLENTVEISRFAISKQRRGATSAALMRMGLVQGLVRLSAEFGVTHWCAVMEPTLLRLMRSTSIYFQSLGPLVDYHGQRQPCYNRLDLLLEAVKEERPEIWRYLTERGVKWQEKSGQLIAA